MIISGAHRRLPPSFCDYCYSFNQASGFVTIIYSEIKDQASLLSVFHPPLPLLSQSHDKELKIATNVKSPDALECTFTFNSFVIHKKSLPSLNYTIHIVLRSLACSQRNLETSEIVSINQLLAFSTLL